MVTVRDVMTAFMELHVSQLKQPASVCCRLRKYFDPLLPLPLESLSVPVVLRWVNEIRQHSPTQADGCLTILRTMLSRAVEWEMYKGANVARLIPRRRQPRRKRYVLKDEIPALLAVLDRQPIMDQVYFYLQLFCAPRPGEIEAAQVTHFKLFADKALWVKPVTKNGDAHQIPLPAFLVERLRWYLSTIPSDQPYLFQVREGHPMRHSTWHRRWDEIRRVARMEDVQMRDLRRTCATYLLNLQSHRIDLQSLSKGVLNHRDLNTTQIYAQPMVETIESSLNANVQEVRALTQGGDHAQSTGTSGVCDGLPDWLHGSETGSAGRVLLRQ